VLLIVGLTYFLERMSVFEVDHRGLSHRFFWRKAERIRWSSIKTIAWADLSYYWKLSAVLFRKDGTLVLPRTTTNLPAFARIARQNGLDFPRVTKAARRTNQWRDAISSIVMAALVVGQLVYTYQIRRDLLMCAAMGGNTAAIRLFMMAGVSPNFIWHGASPLVGSCATNNLEATKALLSGGADPNLRGEHGSNALHFAAMKSTPEVVMLLLEHGAIANVRMDGGLTPYAIARKRGDRKIAELLHAPKH
jgi:hypothetical protein